LQTARTYLRQTRLNDVPTRFGWFNDPEFTRLYIGRPTPTSYEQVENEVKYSFQPMAYSGLMELAIETLHDNLYVGNTFFRKINWQDRHAEFGIFIGPRDLWGAGLGTEITKAMINHGFRELGLHRIWLTIFSYNHRALRYSEKCGFKREAVFRDAVFSGGEYNDVIGFSLLEDDI